MSLNSRFEGPQGERKAISLLRRNPLINGSENLSREILSKGERASFRKGETIIQQGGIDDDIFFLISGSTDIIINQRKVAARAAPDQVGEMSLLNPNAERSADVKASSEVVAIKISENDFDEIAYRNPELWKNMASGLADRLKEREKYWTIPNAIPEIMIDTNVEEIAIARDMEVFFQGYNTSTHIWTSDTLKRNTPLLDTLEEFSKKKDFAVFVLLGDFAIAEEGGSRIILKENQIFEIGLLIGKLGQERVFIVSSKEIWPNLELPSNLLGIKHFLFDHLTPETSLRPVCHQIGKEVARLGPL